MESTSCNRKEVLQELVGDVSDLMVTEGPFGRIRAKNKSIGCEYIHREKQETWRL